MWNKKHFCKWNLFAVASPIIHIWILCCIIQCLLSSRSVYLSRPTLLTSHQSNKCVLLDWTLVCNMWMEASACRESAAINWNYAPIINWNYAPIPGLTEHFLFRGIIYLLQLCKLAIRPTVHFSFSGIIYLLQLVKLATGKLYISLHRGIFN